MWNLHPLPSVNKEMFDIQSDAIFEKAVRLVQK